MARITGVDHLIVVVDDLAAATVLFQDVLGFHIGGGGNHQRFGTTNRIIVLEDEYIELLAAQQGATPTGLVGSLVRRGEGSTACILGMDDAEEFAGLLRENGALVDGPAPGRLEAAGGFSRAWQTVALREPALPGIPFLIIHETGGDERRRLLAGSSGLAPHPNGACRVASVTLAVRDCRATADLFANTLNLPKLDEGVDAMLAAKTSTIGLPSGVLLVLASPAQPGQGPVAAALDELGESMFSLCLAVNDLPGIVKTLRGRAVGVRVDEPGGVLVAAQLNHRSTLGIRIGLVPALR